MIIIDRNRFLMMPEGIPYVEVSPDRCVTDTLIESPLQFKGTTFFSSGDYHESMMDIINSEEESITDELDDQSSETGFSSSGVFDLDWSRNGLFDKDSRFIIFEPNDIDILISHLTNGKSALEKFIKDKANASFPEVINFTEDTLPEDELDRDEVSRPIELTQEFNESWAKGEVQLFNASCFIGWKGVIYYVKESEDVTYPLASPAMFNRQFRSLEMYKYRVFELRNNALFFADDDNPDIINKNPADMFNTTYCIIGLSKEQYLEDIELIKKYSPGKYNFK